MPSGKPATKIVRDGSLDAGLWLLSILTPRGITRTQAEIAYVCGCSMQNIQQIERRALRKLRIVFERNGMRELLYGDDFFK